MKYAEFIFYGSLGIYEGLTHNKIKYESTEQAWWITVG